ncbi:MAG: DegQ family serine endoprotease [Gammaproteobacteria bacterium]|nr:DegQ family serine endoprotease [Gammaproteobacteria bacterium]MDH3561510.1 DegQ family serine endoprotease [Gammaproteobacteria bacterium]
MSNKRIIPGYPLLVLLSLFIAVQSAQAQHLPGFTELVKKAAPAVVNISTTQKVKSGVPQLPEGFEIPQLPEGSPFGELFKHFFDQEEGEPSLRDAQSLGSGSIISADGYILTNYHVVKNADEIIVRLNDRRELRGEVIGTDKRSDIALLKIDADDLPVAKIGKSSSLQVGEWVLAIGSPFGFDYSATAGIVSAKGRSLPRENYVPFIQTDVAINPGNSGGPLFNQAGEVVGVNSQIYSRTGGYMGLSFAIPIEVAMDVADQLKTKGHVSRGWLGVLIQDITLDLAESFGMKQPRGALVAKVLEDSPAEDAGFRVGDVIVAFNGKAIKDSASLPPIVGSTKVGVFVPVDIIRDRNQAVVNVKLGELPEDAAVAKLHKPAVEKANRLGVTVLDLTDKQKQEFELANGVVVERLVDGAASKAGVRKGDIILSLNNETVNNSAQFQELVEALPVNKSVAVLVQRGSSPTFLAIKVPDED